MKEIIINQTCNNHMFLLHEVDTMLAVIILAFQIVLGISLFKKRKQNKEACE